MTEPSDGSQGTLARRAGVVALGTLASRLLGFVRDAVLAAVFTRLGTDAFSIAFTIPNALRVLLGEGAVNAAFIPVYSDLKEKEGESVARRFARHFSGVLVATATLVAGLGIVLAPWLVTIYAPGFDAEELRVTVELTRWMMPYIVFIGLSALATGALNASRRFAPGAFAPAFLNIALIAAMWFAAPQMGALGLHPVVSLGVGALVGGVLQVLVQLPSLRRERLLQVPVPSLSNPAVRRAITLIVPLLAGLGVYQVNVLLARALASTVHGGPTYIGLSQRAAELPQGLFAFAITSASLPVLSTLYSKGDLDGVKAAYRRALRLNLFVTVPSSVALTILATPTIAVLFGRGRFEADDVAATGAVLMFHAAGIWAVASVRTSVPMLFAMGDTKTPVLASGVNLVTFAAVALALLGPMGVPGLAIASSAAALAQLAALVFWVRRRVGSLGMGGVALGAFRTTLASGPMAGGLFGIIQLGRWEQGATLENIAVYGAAVTAGVLLYAIFAWLFRVEELRTVLGTLRRRLGR